MGSEFPRRPPDSRQNADPVDRPLSPIVPDFVCLAIQSL